jgi:hypothetical protein
MALTRNLSSVSGAIPRNAFYNALARSFEFREPISTTAMLFRWSVTAVATTPTRSKNDAGFR